MESDDCFSDTEVFTQDLTNVDQRMDQDLGQAAMETGEDSNQQLYANGQNMDTANQVTLSIAPADSQFSDLSTQNSFHQYGQNGLNNSGYTSPGYTPTNKMKFTDIGTIIPTSTPPRGVRDKYKEERDSCTKHFDMWNEIEQTDFVQHLLSRMCHHQHGQINSFLKPMLQRDFITALPALGMPHVAENILTYLDAKSLCAAERVCRTWYRVIQDGMLWKRLIERNVRTDSLWKGLSDRMGWGQYLFKSGEQVPDVYFRSLYPKVIEDIERIEFNWRCGKHRLEKIQCRSENSKGVYCLQYDDEKIVSGLRDNTIKMWNRKSLENVKVRAISA